MENILEEMSAFFNKRAECYNEVHPKHIGGGLESKDLIASYLPENTKSIIDFGIGTGLELNEIFKRFPDIEVTGLDIADNMLELLRDTYNNKNIILYNQSYLDFDFGFNRYDAAISVMTLHHYTHDIKLGLYKRIYNCIKDNGIYIENDYMLPLQEHNNPQELEDFYFSEYTRLKIEQGLCNNAEYHYDTPCTVENQISLLFKAGFNNVEEVWRVDNAVTLIAKKRKDI
jgi:tRNA (cmo5U34)-methyltransferase